MKAEYLMKPARAAMIMVVRIGVSRIVAAAIDRIR